MGGIAPFCRRYNPNTHLFLVVRMTFEMPYVGGIIRTYQSRMVKLWRFLNVRDVAFSERSPCRGPLPAGALLGPCWRRRLWRL